MGNPARRSLVELANARHCRTTMSNPPSLATMFIQKGVTMNFNLHFLEHDVSIAEDTWTAVVTTGSDASLANVRAVILGVLERGGTFTIEDSNDQAVRRIETAADFEGFMQEVEMQRTQVQQDQAQ
jgi:hypothetical protein